jgi:hypothetical protein
MSTVTDRPADEPNIEPTPEGIAYPDRPEGPVAAAVLAGGVGALTMGLVTTLAEANSDIRNALNWNSDVGPLSGKTLVTVAVWLVAWAILHVVYRNKPYETRRALTIALVLIGLGVVGTFPLFFELFAD